MNSAPLASSADPISSHISAAELMASDRRESQKREILAGLRTRSTPVTSMELAHEAERDGLVGRGPMRACAVNGRPAITWHAKEVL